MDDSGAVCAWGNTERKKSWSKWESASTCSTPTACTFGSTPTPPVHSAEHPSIRAPIADSSRRSTTCMHISSALPSHIADELRHPYWLAARRLIGRWVPWSADLHHSHAGPHNSRILVGRCSSLWTTTRANRHLNLGSATHALVGC
ncbi:ring-h2 zinc finger protein rha4a [Phtheirospermum japonicum]|uniref:Ring-h2 zinc finger protein rha4a n=1 Tax=Phtheirospermum japonicum TaxID=374723 RepID=A0A830BAN6_9LAMI|nr:ring-h2 zinc finger protein rha4a [Phtheirospermum japonicum]